ncbi:hypothetical protein ACO2Q3_08035 [Caulobacter sp. KR2-114]|uniref:hypothetical protein n=1 Tax=Caulobacter sp. KR2-114 TaxID=3400912 RepID=UPI003C090429
MKRILIAATAVLALGACSRGGDLNHGGSIKLGSSTISKQLPANLPGYVKVYPGATVTAVMDNGAQGGIIAFDVADSPDSVVSFYRKAAEDAKLTQTTDTASSTGSHVIMWNQEGTKRSLMATVDLKQGKTHVGLLYGAAS